MFAEADPRISKRCEARGSLYPRALGREWMRKPVCTHGDLNASNLAFDENTDGGWHAYIIDAGSLQSDLAVRDYAALEVSLLLHQASSDGIPR
jgi:Ser/Thr protein kinase RdoA (MazF antagonist)